ncbi:MAG: YihA family ribosome biogenesis GTP-binding protein [Rhodospirillales bacterium]|nr:YihA family ribosome biogenesis GTP-binding protein [Rhodospirillales bacterium]
MNNSDTPDTAADAELAALVETGRKLFAGPCDFVLGVATESQLPDTGLTEIAFAGRSNVGKSSLINALTGRKTLARTSNTPGRTKQINFFNLSDQLMLVDLPGYGYARATKSHVAEWTELIEHYLKGRQPLRRACLLIDARHGLKDNDRQAMKLMDASAVAYQVVLTKSDKIKPPALQRLIDETLAELASHTAAHPEICATSAIKGTGIPELRAGLAALA